MRIVDWIIDRLAERSTWLGLAGLVAAVGISLSPEQAEAIAVAGMAVGGAIAVFTKDRA